MKMKRLLAVSMVLSLYLPLNFASATTVPRIGAKCKKVGLISKKNTNEFVCSKSGTKLVWKQKFPRKLEDKPAQAPDLNQGIIRGENYVYRFLSGELQRLAIDGKTFTSTDSRIALSFDDIRVSAFKEMQRLSESNDPMAIELSFKISENYPVEVASAVKLQARSAAKKLSYFLEERISITFILVTEKDVDFLKTNFGKFNRDDELQTIIENMKDYKFGTSTTGGGFGGYGIDENNASGGSVVIFYPSYQSMEKYYPEIVPHEMTHVIQQYFQTGATNTQQDYFRKLSKNYIEGSANLLGFGLSLENLGWYSDDSDLTFIQYWKNWHGSNRMANSEDVISILNSTASFNNRDFFFLAYPIGHLFWEFVIAKYGIDSYSKFLKNIKLADSYEQNLLMSVGKSKKELYLQAAPYILKVWQRLGLK